VRLLFAILIFSVTAACTRYGVHNDSARQYPVSEITLPSSREELAGQIQNFLKSRGFKPHVERHQTASVTDLELDWVRESSLEYFYILSGSRTPHLSHWKAVWRITDEGPRKTNIRIEIMELLYMGPQDEAGPTPSLNGQWVEAPDSHLRGWIELRRFFTETFPRQSLPKELTLIQVPSLEMPPLSLQEYRPLKSHQSSRPSPF